MGRSSSGPPFLTMQDGLGLPAGRAGARRGTRQHNFAQINHDLRHGWPAATGQVRRRPAAAAALSIWLASHTCSWLTYGHYTSFNGASSSVPFSGPCFCPCIAIGPRMQPLLAPLAGPWAPPRGLRAAGNAAVAVPLLLQQRRQALLYYSFHRHLQPAVGTLPDSVSLTHVVEPHIGVRAGKGVRA